MRFVTEISISGRDPDVETSATKYTKEHHAQENLVTIAWQDGVTETFSLLDGERQFTRTHRFTQPGHYQVTVWIVDDDGGINARSFDLFVRPWSLFLPVMQKP